MAGAARERGYTDDAPRPEHRPARGAIVVQNCGVPVLILYVCRDGERARRFSTTKPRYCIGRAADNDLVLDGGGVADHHCVLVLDDAGCAVEPRADMFVNGRLITAGASLSGTDRLFIGDFSVSLEHRAVAIDPVEEALLAAACDGDLDARLVYADWLEGNGQLAHAEFLRLEDQVIAERIDDDGPTALRLRELASTIDAQWRMRLARSRVHHCDLPSCDLDWSQLTEIGIPGVRHCDLCHDDVAYLHVARIPAAWHRYVLDRAHDPTPVLERPTPRYQPAFRGGMMANPPMPRHWHDDD